jgi:hypothetical protein
VGIAQKSNSAENRGSGMGPVRGMDRRSRKAIGNAITVSGEFVAQTLTLRPGRYNSSFLFIYLLFIYDAFGEPHS